MAASGRGPAFSPRYCDLNPSTSPALYVVSAGTEAATSKLRRPKLCLIQQLGDGHKIIRRAKELHQPGIRAHPIGARQTLADHVQNPVRSIIEMCNAGSILAQGV